MRVHVIQVGRVFVSEGFFTATSRRRSEPPFTVTSRTVPMSRT